MEFPHKLPNGNQVLSTTHPPFMIDAEHLETVRLVDEDQATALLPAGAEEGSSSPRPSGSADSTQREDAMPAAGFLTVRQDRGPVQPIPEMT